MSRTRKQWVELAERRVLNILNTHKCCPIRMLEAKISEAGPGDIRPNPVSISAALQSLSAKKLIKTIPKRTHTETPFYAPASAETTSPLFSTILERRRHLYLLHKGLTERDEFCSQVMERIIDSAIENSGSAPAFLSRFPTQNLPQDRPLDFVVEINGTSWGGEVKNFREWFYPDSWEIWLTISKCCELDVVPLFVARKLPYVSFLFFGNAGMVGFQTHFQYFHPEVAPELTRVIAVDGLGYKDIHCTLAPSPQLLNFFGKTIPRIGSDFASRFASKKSLLSDFADNQRLADRKFTGRARTRVFSAAWKAIVGSDFASHLS